MGMSSTEKAVNKMKQVRHLKRQRQLEENRKKMEMGTEAYEKMLADKAKRSTKEILDTAIWDYEKNQYPRVKYDYLKNLIKERLEEIKNNGSEDEEAKLKLIYREL